MTEKSIHSFIGFYYLHPIEDWNYNNLLEYYRMESKENEIKKILDYIKKDLQRVETEFDLKYREKAREILNNWDNWKVSLLG